MSELAPKRGMSRGLGRGLSALMGEVEREAPVEAGDRAGVQLIDHDRIDPDPDQPRRHFDDAALDELSRSIGARGLIQPIVVRPVAGGAGRYLLVAGERRWRAAGRAGLRRVPAIVRDFDYHDALEIALLENIQREDLNAIEEARGYKKLIDEIPHTQESVARLVHKSRSHIANLLRLLDLPPAVQDMLAQAQISMGHARALLGVPDADALAKRIVAEGLSVRDVERLATAGRTTTRRPRQPKGTGAADGDVAVLERQLGDLLGLKVRIAHGANGGAVTLGYATLDQLDMICQRLSGEAI